MTTDDDFASATTLVDLINMPGFNPASQHDRGEWGLRSVTDGSVTADATGHPRCVDHGAMNAVNEGCTLWRCLNCGRGCFRPAASDFSPATAAGEGAQVGEGTGVRVNDAGTDPGGGPGAGLAPGVHDATVAAMLMQRCGRCKAVPGEPCRTERGNPSYGPHTSRWYAARRAGVLPERGEHRGD